VAKKWDAFGSIFIDGTRGTPRFSYSVLRRFGLGVNQVSCKDNDDSALSVPSERADEIFLEGPRSRFEEFITLKVMRDFLRGFRVLHIVGPCVTGLRLDPVSSEMI
jgi:hypothetical protein